MNGLLQKDELSKELGISLATVNNWIKTQVIPSPDIQNYYSKETFNSIIKDINNNQKRLNSRANRKQSDKNDLCFLGIADKKRKELLSVLIQLFERNKLTFNEGILALSFSLLCSANLIDKNWKFNESSRLDKFLSDWMKETKDYEFVKNLFLDFGIQNCNDD
jgi:hypothetical protein